MSSYVYRGFPIFLESAAAELGLSGSAGAAGRILPLTALSNLCAQAAHGEPAHARDILARAAEFRDHLAVALRAAELMLADVEGALGSSSLEDRPGIDTPAALVPSAEPRRARKGPSNLRESS